MLFPNSPLDFVEAIERERRQAIRVDARRTGFLRRLASGIKAVSRQLRARRARAVPKPA